MSKIFFAEVSYKKVSTEIGEHVRFINNQEKYILQI